MERLLYIVDEDVTCIEFIAKNNLEEKLAIKESVKVFCGQHGTEITGGKHELTNWNGFDCGKYTEYTADKTAGISNWDIINLIKKRADKSGENKIILAVNKQRLLKKSDRKIKTEATKQEYQRVFDFMNVGRDIFAECSDGTWVRRFWSNPNGSFGWGRWDRLK
jgi:hypothetical protein